MLNKLLLALQFLALNSFFEELKNQEPTLLGEGGAGAVEGGAAQTLLGLWAVTVPVTSASCGIWDLSRAMAQHAEPAPTTFRWWASLWAS